MPLQRSIALLGADQELRGRLEHFFEKAGCRLVVLTDASILLGVAYADPPDVVLIDLSAQDPAHLRALKELKQDSYFSEIPVIGLIRGPDSAGLSWEQCPIDDFVSLPLDDRELRSRILLSQHRIRRIFDNNPLSKLPGNTSIQHAIEQALGTRQAVCYLDINNFKPYNDTYGFSRGDEVLRMVARILSNSVRETCTAGFVGHIGGDDFVFIIPKENAEPVCRRVIDNFNIILTDLFSEPDKVRGFYVARNRKGAEEQYPLLGISIAVVLMDSARIQHAGKVAEIAAELKKLAKRSPSSSYIIDRRG